MSKACVLFCDDRAHDPDAKFTYSTVKALLKKVDIDVLPFDGTVDGRIPNPIQASEVGQRIINELRQGGHEGLIMDLRWWTKHQDEENEFGLELIEWIVTAGLPAPLTLDKIIVLTHYDHEVARVRERLASLNIPEQNAFSKWHPHGEREITAVFSPSN